MDVWEPDSWTFSEKTFKAYDAQSSSDGELSDDEPLFTKSKTLRKKHFKTVKKEELLPE
mgnify:CR=1 FL=1